MLRLSTSLHAAVAAVALLAGAAAQGQSAGLSGRLDAAEKQLDGQIKTCGTITVADYYVLLREARANKRRNAEATKAGMSIDQTLVDGDLARAETLYDRAYAKQREHDIAVMDAQSLLPSCDRLHTHPGPESLGHGQMRGCSGEEGEIEEPPANLQDCPTKEQVTTQPAQTLSLPTWAQDMLVAHNAARAAVGSPPLRWDPVLQAHATARANELARARQLTHAPREGRGTERENILSAPLSYSPARMIKLWTDESRHFVPGVFPNVCDTGGDCSNVWHYTQVVSYLSTDLGCGYAPGGGFNWLVCRYNPGGNKDGKPVIADVNSTIRARQIGGDYTGTFGPPPDNDDVNSVAFYDPNFPGFDEPINDSGDTKVEPSLPSNYVDTLVEPPTLTQAEIFRPLSQWEIRNRDYGAIMMMYASGNPYQRAYSQFTFARVLFYAGERSCSLATMMVGRAQAQAALAALKKIQSELPEGGDMAIVDAEELKGTIDDFESLMGQSNSCPTDSSTAGSDTAASDTSVEQPELPTGEVFDPDPPKKPADVM